MTGFTYTVDLYCSGAGCGRVRNSGVCATAREAEATALENARRAGWLQIGDQCWCPGCARSRMDWERVALAREQAGLWVPRYGLVVRYVGAASAPGPVPDGHRYSAAERLTLGEAYTIVECRWADQHLMLSFGQGQFFNAALFSPDED